MRKNNNKSSLSPLATKPLLSSRKADVSQVFVYLFSIIIISFAGFLVIKFVGAFSSDVESRTDIVFFDNLESVYQQVAQNWNSEKLQTFKVTSDVEYVCFMEKSCQPSSLPVDPDTVSTILEGGDNVALFSSQDNLIQSGKIGTFQIEKREDCECITPEENRIELFIRNNRNEVSISP